MRKIRNGIFGVFVEISVEDALIHKIGFAADIEEYPSQVMQLEVAREESDFLAIASQLSFRTRRIVSFSARLDLRNIVKP